MKSKKSILLVIGCVLVIGFIVFLTFNKFGRSRKPKTLIENVEYIYSSALSKNSSNKLYSNVYEKDDTLESVNDNLKYMVKVNDKGEIVYLVVSNGVERFQMGSLNESKPIKLKDLTKDKIVKDETIIKEDKFINVEYEVIKSGSDKSYKTKGYFVDKSGNITICLGQKNSGSYNINIANIYAQDDEYTINVNVDEPNGDYQIQVLSYPFITIKLKNNDYSKLYVKNVKGDEFKLITNDNTEVESDTEKENKVKKLKEKKKDKIKSIIIEKKPITEKDLDELDKDFDGKITTEDIKLIEIEKVMCEKGKYLKDNECLPCPNNTYGSDGITCTSCPVGTCTSGNAKSVRECKKCASLIDPVKPELVTE